MPGRATRNLLAATVVSLDMLDMWINLLERLGIRIRVYVHC